MPVMMEGGQFFGGRNRGPGAEAPYSPWNLNKSFIPSAVPGTPGVEAAGAVRSTAGGPFDSAYRQNLATFAGGDLARPEGGVLSFNPLAADPFGGQMPDTLLGQAFKRREAFQSMGSGNFVPGGNTPLFVPAGTFPRMGGGGGRLFEPKELSVL